MKHIVCMVALAGVTALGNGQSHAAECENGRVVSTKNEHYCLVSVDGREVMQGVYRSMYPDGSVKMEGEYNNGEKCGSWTYWSSRGRKIEATEYRDGKKSGLSRQWSANSGNLVYEGTYRDGKPVGTHEKWYDDGKKLSESVFETQGADTVMEEIQWHVNGQKKAHYQYVNGQHHGSYERWFMDGKPEEKGRYGNGKRVGEWKRWNNKGEETVRTY